MAKKIIDKHGAEPLFLNYQGYPNTACISINEAIVHGIPSKSRTLKEGDIVSVDIGLRKDGFCADKAVSYSIGTLSPEDERLVEATRNALEGAIDMVRPGKRLGDVSARIQSIAEAAGFNVVRDYTGHGIGRDMHEGPFVMNYGKPGTGIRLKPGLVIAIEPMVNQGTYKTRLLDDNWTVVTADGQPSAHFENVVAIGNDKTEILTAA